MRSSNIWCELIAFSVLVVLVFFDKAGCFRLFWNLCGSLSKLIWSLRHKSFLSTFAESIYIVTLVLQDYVSILEKGSNRLFLSSAKHFLSWPAVLTYNHALTNIYDKSRIDRHMLSWKGTKTNSCTRENKSICRYLKLKNIFFSKG